VNARDLERYKRLLLAKQDELSAAGETATPVSPADEPEGDLMDRASADAEAELHIRLHATEGRLHKAIEDALTRIRAGTFGVCQVCQQPISKARLEAVPWTRLCRECKDREQPAA
jgi:DnaK suppressor protein